jgi:hypothetical protein
VTSGSPIVDEAAHFVMRSAEGLLCPPAGVGSLPPGRGVDVTGRLPGAVDSIGALRQAASAAFIWADRAALSDDLVTPEAVAPPDRPAVHRWYTIRAAFQPPYYHV